MKPIDLTNQPPRSPYQKMEGLRANPRYTFTGFPFEGGGAFRRQISGIWAGLTVGNGTIRDLFEIERAKTYGRTTGK